MEQPAVSEPRRLRGRDAGSAGFQPANEGGQEALAPRVRGRVELDPENVRRGLGRLVLALVELLRQLLERQAVRRLESGSLTAAEVERLGVTFKRLKDEMAELKKYFGVTDADLNLDLGPLGKLF